MHVAWPHGRSFRAGLRVAVLAIAVPGSAIVTPALAQPAPEIAAAKMVFAIGPQPLSAALRQFVQESGVQVAYATPDGENVASPGVSGSFTPEEALGRVLVGTGLTYRFTGASTATLERLPAGSSGIVLSPVQVEGQQDVETATGPGVGYVAHLSTAATKTSTPLIETPQSVSIVTRKQMDAQNVQSVPGALRYTAGVLPEQRGVNEAGLEYIYGRGFLIDSYLNGLRLPTGNTGTDGYNLAGIDPYLLDRIEVLHGPASVLYGQASPGGVVNLASKLPTSDPPHEVFLQTGEDGRLQGGFDLGGPVDKDGQFLYRLTGTGLDTDTQIHHIKNQRIAIAPALTWHPNDSTTLTLLASYQYDPQAGFYNFVPAVGTVLPNPHGKISSSFDPGDPDFDKHSRTQASIGYMLEHHFDSVFTVRQNVRYLDIDSNFQNVFGNGLLTNQQSLSRYSFFNKETLGYWTVDNQAEADFATGSLHHTMLVGVDYAHTSGTERYGFNYNVPSINVFAPVYGQRIPYPTTAGIEDFTIDRVGLYAQDQIKLGRWSLLLGGRQDWYDATDHERLSNTTGTQSNRPFTWRTGLVYQLDNGIAPYASYTTSFQPTTSSDYTGNLLQPTTAEQYELGVKYQPPGFNSFVTASAFNLTEQNVPTTDPSHPSFSISTGEIRARGIELEGHASLSDNLDLVASYTYLDDIVTKSNTTNLNKAPTGIPRNMASAWANYKFTSGAANGLSLGAGARYVGSTYGTSTNTFAVPDYTLFDASIQYELGAARPELQGWTATLTASNVFDKTYVASCTSLTNCAYGLRRLVLGRLSYKW